MVKSKSKKPADHLYVEGMGELKSRLAAVAEANHRSMNKEAIAALERYVRAEEARIKAEMESEQ